MIGNLKIGKFTDKSSYFLILGRARPARPEPRSHSIGWAEGPKTRMDPRNGLCLSPTYDAAFDRKLITPDSLRSFPWLRSAGPWHFPSAGSCGIGFDEDYRLVLSRAIREHVPSQNLRDYFLNRAGQRIELPNRFLPLQTYLAAHRDGGDF